MGDPRVDYLVRRVVVAEGVDQDLSSAIELSAEDPMWAVGFVKCATAVLDRCAEVVRRVLIFEAFDVLAFDAGEQKTDHHVVKASIDEIVDDRSQLWLPAELFKQTHPRDDPDAM